LSSIVVIVLRHGDNGEDTLVQNPIPQVITGRSMLHPWKLNPSIIMEGIEKPKNFSVPIVEFNKIQLISDKILWKVVYNFV
jgi:hypothetical protein